MAKISFMVTVYHGPFHACYTVAMTKNIGTVDRVLRFVIGLALLAVALFVMTSVFLKVVVILFAVFCFYEALASWCLFYQLIGRNTCPIA